MSARATWIAIALAVGLAACTDPGCIRNSECPIDYRCLGAVCTHTGDAGATPELPPKTDAASPMQDAAMTPEPSGDDAGSR